MIQARLSTEVLHHATLETIVTKPHAERLSHCEIMTLCEEIIVQELTRRAEKPASMSPSSLSFPNTHYENIATTEQKPTPINLVRSMMISNSTYLRIINHMS